MKELFGIVSFGCRAYSYRDLQGFDDLNWLETLAPFHRGESHAVCYFVESK